MKESGINTKIRLVSPVWFAKNFDQKIKADVLISSQVTLDEADGLIVIDDPSAELLEFNGPKIWFSSEPSWHVHYHKHPVGKRATRQLDLTERAWHSNPNEKFRVPHPTHWDLNTVHNEERIEKAVAVVTNYGGRTWFLKEHFRFRNSFILEDSVDLYGRPQSWINFRAPPNLLRKQAPANFRGEVPRSKDILLFSAMTLLSKYKVAVCLENSVEGFYFTEKMVNACRCGCIPVFHASEAVRKTFLQGARWVDPVDFKFNPKLTIEYALAQKLEDYQEANYRWLKESIPLQSTSYFSISETIFDLMLEKIKSETSPKRP